MPFRIIALLCLLSGAAGAAEVETPSPEAAASEAADIVDKHCSDVASSGTSHAAAAFTEVSPVWARVSRSYDLHKTLFLLYWRGVLSQCLDQEERAQEDLVAFIAAAEGDTTMASQVTDSRRRLRHLNYRGDAVGRRAAEPFPAGLALSVGGGAGVAAGLGLHFGGYQGSGLEQQDEEWVTSQDSGTYDTMRGLNLAGFGLALGAGATTVVGLIVAAASGGPTGRVAAAPYVLPTERGAVFGIGGSW